LSDVIELPAGYVDTLREVGLDGVRHVLQHGGPFTFLVVMERRDPKSQVVNFRVKPPEKTWRGDARVLS